jgi:NTE family protein
LLVSALMVLASACAAPFQRATAQPPAAAASRTGPPVKSVARPTIGVAFGGGSARGIAHVGVIRWLEEHRIPIDMAAGTSMGGLIGGAFASGMDADELEVFIASVDWDHLFGASSYAYKNIRRKADGRAYPSRLEFGLRGGIVPPTALNDGESVELLLARIAAPYYDIETFDDLPTPFRTVAVDLLRAQPVVMGAGWLADAMRATMSLPLIFSPVELDGQMLIDGGTMNNVPADIVKSMGADRVIAINVGDLSDREGVSYTMFGVAGNALDAMMRASTKRALAAADVTVNVPLAKYGSLDWRRAADLIEEGYRAAESMRDRLLPFSVSDAEFAAWRLARHERRRTELPTPAFIELDGFAKADERRLNASLARHVGAPLDLDAVERDILIVAGLDRYQTVTWRPVHDRARGCGLRVRGRIKAYAPPFMMLGLNLENTTSSDFRITATARYLAFDTVGSGSELRLDGTIGSDPGAGIELYRPIGPTPLFAAPFAGVERMTFNFIERDAITARYKRTIARAGLHVGLNLGARSDVRVGAYVGRSTASIEVGDPGFPELQGKETGADIVWRIDTQDNPVVPSRGLVAQAGVLRVFTGPEVVIAGQKLDFDSSFTQLSAAASHFWSAGPRNRLFVYGGAGTSFDATPLPTDQFALGTPFRLGAYRPGELRGPHYYVATGGYLRRVARLPDFMGGAVFAGGWLENGDAFDRWRHAGWKSNGGAGLVMDTIVGPVILAGSWSFDGRWRTYFGVGRVFR